MDFDLRSGQFRVSTAAASGLGKDDLARTVAQLGTQREMQYKLRWLGEPASRHPTTGDRPADEDDARSRAQAKTPTRARGFVVPMLDGGAFDFAAILGHQPAALIFWASWCGPCVDEAPHLARLYREFGPSRVAFLSISIDGEQTRPNLATVVNELRIPYPVGLDPDGNVLSLYTRDPAIPLVYLISRDGVIQHAHHNFEAGDER
ncbi:MAG: TlpA disulfide reductase family protein, partial [Nannocystaceae bacterium]